MSSKTWIYIIVLAIILLGGGGFFYWQYRAGKIKPKAEVAPTEQVQTFCDVKPADWGFKEVEAVNEAGYMVGYDSLCTPDVDEKKQFKPQDGTPREQMAGAFSRASEGPGSVTCPPDPYSDVSSDNQFCANIKDLDKDHKAYMQGYEDGTFKPSQVATRTEAAITLVRAKSLDIENPPATPSFDDVPITADNSNHYKEIEAIYKAGYTTGCNKNVDDQGNVHLNFCPTLPLERTQLAVFLYNAYLATTGGSPTPQASPTEEVSPTTEPSPTETPTPTPTPEQTATATPTPQTSAGAGAGTTTKPAKTGPEIPLAAGGLLGALFVLRYLVNKKIK